MDVAHLEATETSTVTKGYGKQFGKSGPVLDVAAGERTFGEAAPAPSPAAAAAAALAAAGATPPRRRRGPPKKN